MAVLLWSTLCALGMVFGARESRDRVAELAALQARAVSQTVIDFRSWNAGHGGVYVPVDAQNPPNPYLPAEERSLTTDTGRLLALINPAQMTRLAGEVSARTQGPSFRVTSLKPLRPENAPLPWERQALTALEHSRVPEFGRFDTPEGGPPVYRYAAPLITEAACLKCHEVQGYRVGDIRGAVTITLPAERFVAAEYQGIQAAYATGILAWLLGLVAIFFFDRSARARRALLERLQELSLRDGLTGLHNRRGFEIRSQQALETLMRERGSAVLVYADLDGLKAINDRFGHQRGDEALTSLGQLLGQEFRGSDIVARIGGDEFAILLVDATWAHRPELEQRFADILRRANEAWVAPPKISMSLGMVPIEFESDEQGFDVQTLLDQADEQMYQAKRGRRKEAPSAPPTT